METEIEILRRQLSELQLRVETLESYHKSSQPVQQRDLSIGEFIAEFNPKVSLNDKTLLVGYFKEINEKISPLTKSVIEAGFDEARESPPRNVSDSINNNLDKKFFVIVKNQKDEKSSERTFRITRAGIKRVEEEIKRRENK
jgi:hypothetical protein